MAKDILILVVFLISGAHFAPITDDFVLSLPDGKIQGATYVTPNNKTYFGFRGIPYAAPPVGDLRFEAPEPSPPWDGIWNATTDSSICISVQNYGCKIESEDCLYINVYVPTLQPKEKLPVMFWITGGGFISGVSSKSYYGPDFLIEEDVIMVSFNYRVGPLGFISTGDKVLPGNLGLKDQTLALKWTSKNIEYFGGDPEKITIFGESSGGISVGLHLISKQSAGLYRAGILESGSALLNFIIDQDPKTTAYLIADGIPGGNYGNDTQKLKDFLVNSTVEDIMTSFNSLPMDSYFRQQTWPVLEIESEGAFLTKSNYELLANGNFRQVPIVIGICAEESQMLLKDLENTKKVALLFDSDKTKAIPGDLYPNSTDEAAIADKIRSIYLKDDETFSSNLVAFAEYSSDNLFATGTIKHAELASKYVPVYMYQFAYLGRPISQPFIDGAEKASHSAELPFIFNMASISDTVDPEDLLTQDRMVKLWTNFAKYLNPTPEESDLFENIMWPTFDVETFPYLNINNTLEVRTNFKGNSYPEWNDIYETYGRKPFITF